MKPKYKPDKKRKLKPSRRLSQNFLTDRQIAARIADALEIKRGEAVLEIGAGKGFLTEYLVERGGQVLAIDKDSRMIGLLKKKFPKKSGVKIIFADILNMPEDLLPEEKCALIGNLPYGISHPLIFWILARRHRWRQAVIMLQREVAQRLCAGPGEKGRAATSVFAQLQCAPRYLFEVGPAAFYPRPRVTSAVVRLNFPATEDKVETDDYFRYIVEVAFAQKRKILANNLAAIPGVTSTEVALVFEEAGIDPKQRAEQLRQDEFFALSKAARHVWGTRLAAGGRGSAASRPRSTS